jgi:uncharacterized protein with GYD domain
MPRTMVRSPTFIPSPSATRAGLLSPVRGRAHRRSVGHGTRRDDRAPPRRRARNNGRRSLPTVCERTAVPTYIMLSRLTPEGVQTIKNNPQRIKEVNREIEQLGAEVKAQWATLGQFDFVNVIEAPDDLTMSRISLELGSRGTARYESMSAIPIDDFMSAL